MAIAPTPRYWRGPTRAASGSPPGARRARNATTPPPARDDPIAEDDAGEAGATVVAGDERSGPILAVVDEQANCGTAAYRGLIHAPTGAGLHVFAGNEAGASFGGCRE